MAEKDALLRIGHSPDPDDAFMWFPLTGIDGGPPLIDTGRFRYEAVQEDIESLNQRSEIGDLEITAISMAQFPYVHNDYALTNCGASMGDGYGPKIVARAPVENVGEYLRRPEVCVAIPGARTSARLATALLLGVDDFNAVAVPFEEIMARVAEGEFAAGVIIHEGQLTYEDSGLHLLVDLGAWWKEQTQLLLPLGANAIRRDLEDRYGPGTLVDVSASLLRSIQYALAHREEAISYAMRFGRGLDRGLADEFVAMYVNKFTLDFGPAGRQAVKRFLGDAAANGLTPTVDPKAIFVEQT